MITERMRSYIGYTLHFQLYQSLSGYINWDPKSRRFIPTNNYMFWNGVAFEYSIGFLMAPVLLTWLVLQLTDDHLLQHPIAFASHLIGWTELCTLLVIMFVSRRIRTHRRQICHTLNEMFSYAEYLTGKRVKYIDKIHLILKLYLFRNFRLNRNANGN